MRPVRTKPGRKPPTSKTSKDPVEVFCRIRPLENENDMVCIKPVSSTVVHLVPPNNSVFKSATKEIQCKFSYVFDDKTSQKLLFDHVALPLIDNLIQGKDGLLFTYGITSSGKTYTMTGIPENPGILPRSLDVIFNTIKDSQTPKYIFTSDKFNGFDIHTNSEARAEQLKETCQRTPKPKRKDDTGWNGRTTDETCLENVDTDSGYAVFVSYVEIYNNYIYDLLDDTPIDHFKSKQPLSKLLREDSNHSMYVSNATELEVKSADEAFETFCKGQQKRRVAHTALNTESSRSHSVMNIRITRAPLDPQGAEVLQDKNQITVSQLSLVDLAGSERCVRTGNSGDRLRETGNINSSLMALRTCIELLRENQTQNGNKMVPYRDNKLTHLFKNFFEGEGKIQMIVCINPRADDYDEAVHVMRFAEMTQEVMVSRPTPVANPVHSGLRAGRGNAYKEAVQKAKEEGVDVRDFIDSVYTLGPPIPDQLIEVIDESSLIQLLQFLTDRKARRQALLKDLNSKQNDFRKNMVLVEQEDIRVKQKLTVLNMDLEGREQQVRNLERKLTSAEYANNDLKRKYDELEEKFSSLQQQLQENNKLLGESEREKKRMKTDMHERLVLEKGRMRHIMEQRLAQKQAELEEKMCLSDEKIRQLRDIINSEDWNFGDIDCGIPTSDTTPKVKIIRENTKHRFPPPIAPKPVTPKPATPRVHSEVELKENVRPISSTSTPRSVAVANPRHRRSNSLNSELWLDHCPPGSLELGTVLQPRMKRKKSVSKLHVKDIKDTSKYVLTHQEQDCHGEIETQLYKGDVIPSVGGGAQIIFNDVEKLRQVSPTSSNIIRKCNAEEMSRAELESRCAVGVECHGKTPSKKTKY